MEEKIPPPIPSGQRASDSAPTLGLNTEGANTSQSSLPDINSKQKQRKSHKDFPEIRAYYAK